MSIRLLGGSGRVEVGGDTVYALRDVNLAVDEAEFVVVLGTAGSATTSLLDLR